MLKNLMRWQEWRGCNNRCPHRGWTLSSPAQHPRNPEQTRGSVPPRSSMGGEG